MNQKAVIAILGVVVVILLGTTVYFATISNVSQPVAPGPKVAQQPAPTTTKQQSVVQPTTPTTQPVPAIADWKNYKNDKYGFELTFPSTWQGYKAINRTLDWGANGTSDSIDFGFTAQGSSDIALIFNVSMHSKTQWKKIKSEQGPTPTYLGENSLYVFAYSPAQDVATDFERSRMTEIESIIKTFKITK